MTEERIKQVKAWQKNLSYKKGTMAYRALKYLEDQDEKDGVAYFYIRQQEGFNYERNIGNLKARIYWLEYCIPSREREHPIKKKQWAEEPIAHGHRWAIEHTEAYKDWGLSVESTDAEIGKVFAEKDLESIKDLKIELQGVKDELTMRESKGVAWEAKWPGEPNYSQLVVTMLVDKTIEKIRRGFYRVTNTGRGYINE